jgi:hypothetical protein
MYSFSSFAERAIRSGLSASHNGRCGQYLVLCGEQVKRIQEREQGVPLTRDRGQQQTDKLAGENRAGTTAEEIAVSFRNHMTHSVGRPLESSSLVDKYHALSAVVRDRLMDQWLETIETYKQKDVRVLAYLSAEYLLGPHLQNDLLNLDLAPQVEQALKSLGLDLKTIAAEEPEQREVQRLPICIDHQVESAFVLKIGSRGEAMRVNRKIGRPQVHPVPLNLCSLDEFGERREITSRMLVWLVELG